MFFLVVHCIKMIVDLSAVFFHVHFVIKQVTVGWCQASTLCTLL